MVSQLKLFLFFFVLFAGIQWEEAHSRIRNQDEEDEDSWYSDGLDSIGKEEWEYETGQKFEDSPEKPQSRGKQTKASKPSDSKEKDVNKQSSRVEPDMNKQNNNKEDDVYSQSDSREVYANKPSNFMEDIPLESNDDYTNETFNATFEGADINLQNRTIICQDITTEQTVCQKVGVFAKKLQRCEVRKVPARACIRRTKKGKCGLEICIRFRPPTNCKGNRIAICRPLT